MNSTKKLTLASMCLALGVIVPQAFHAIPNAGTIFLPMHIPVLVCGFICGPLYGLIDGILTPILSNMIFSMPQAPMLGQMVVELATYGLMSGLLNKCINIKNIYLKNYVVLISSMIIGSLYVTFLALLISIPTEGGKWKRLISNKRLDYVQGKTYLAKAKVIYIDIRQFTLEDVKIFYWVEYLDKEEDAIFRHSINESDLKNKKIF